VSSSNSNFTSKIPKIVKLFAGWLVSVFAFGLEFLAIVVLANLVLVVPAAGIALLAAFAPLVEITAIFGFLRFLARFALLFEVIRLRSFVLLSL
jgi:hypothetical protein